MRLIIEPLAQADIDEIADWYDGQDFDVGSAFLVSLKSLFSRVTANPARYPLHKPGLRRARLQRFPHNVFYIHKSESVFIIAVLHHRRDLSVLDERVN